MEEFEKISHFESIADKHPSSISIDDFVRSIKSGKIHGRSIKKTIEHIRSAADSNERSKLKRTLPAVTLSAECSGGHKKANIISTTGLIQIDIDKLEDVDKKKEQLKDDPFIKIMFVSPSGNGLKCILKIGSSPPNHLFESICSYFKEQYAIEVDKQVKDESRLCFYSYDPDIFINDNAIEFVAVVNKPDDSPKKLTPDIEHLISKLEAASIDVTTNYNDWIMLAFALTDAFGAAGEQYFHRISKFYPGYNQKDCSKQYHECMKSGSRNISIKSLISFVTGKLGKQESKIPDVTRGIKPLEDIIFYTPSYDKDGNLKDLKIDYTKWIEVLYGLGFRRFDIGKNFVFVRVVDQIIEEVSVTHIQDAFIHFLESLPENLPGGVSREFLIGKIYRNPSHYFCENRLNLLRPKEQFQFTEDTKDTCFIYFKNGFVRCTRDGYQLLPYEQLAGLIWKNQIVDRGFTFLDFMSSSPQEKGEFSFFTFNLCGKNPERYESLTSIIGYLLHSHFSGKLKAVVLTDSKISDVPSGRTGKTLLGQGLGYAKKYTELNGKDFDSANKHKYQELDLDTQIVHLNDVKKSFDFESLFNDITEGIVVDKKNIKPFKVKAKMIISTNKTIRIEGASARDRAIEFEFADYYNEKFSPEDEFHHWFFRDWDETEWMKFFNFCLFCISSYLKTGIVVAAPVNLNRRKLLENTNQEFVEFMDSQVKEGEIKPGIEYDKKGLFDRFLLESPEFADIKSFKQRRFTECLRTYAKYSGHFSAVDPDANERKSGNVRYITFPPP
ncbi:MAG: BT4734/BF3469 family protein [Bacteroidota bacterium]